MRIIIKHSYAVVCVGLKVLLEERLQGVEITCCADDDELAVLPEDDGQVDLLIYGMSTDTVRDLQRLIGTQLARNEYPAPVLVISDLCEAVYAPLCIAAGAKGFVSMTAGEDVIMTAVQTVLGGDVFVSWSLRQHPVLVRAMNTGGVDVFRLLSARERQIATHLLSNRSLTEISLRLGLRYTTVATYRDRILKKTRVTDLTQLAMLASRGHQTCLG